MRITSITTYPITVGLTRPIQMAHVTITESHNVLVKIETDAGVTGWGEGVSALRLTGENQARIIGSVEFLSTLLIGEDPLSITRLWNRMTGAVHGNETAIGAVDMALYDIAGKAYGVPVHQLIGGAVRDVIPVLCLLGTGNPPADAADTSERVAAGYRWFKVKLGLAGQVAELETVAAVCEAAGPDSVVCADANEAWTEHQAVEFINRLGDLPVRFLEQPIPDGDPDAMVRVAQQVPIPICVDQSVHSLADIRRFGGTSVGGVSLKSVKLAGITGLMRGAHLCGRLGLEINLAGKIAETSIAAAANLHAASAMASIDWGVSPGNQGIDADVAQTMMSLVDGAFAVPQGPGLGVEVDEGRVAALGSR